MFFLKDVCEISDVLKVIYFVEELLKILFIIVPVGLILMLSVDFAKNVIAGNVDEMQKNFNLALKRILMAVGLFLVPTIVSFLVSFLGSLGVPYADCLENANLSQIEVFEEQEKKEEEERKKQEESENNNHSADLSGGGSGMIAVSGQDGGKGKATDIKIKYHVKDSKGRCGKGSGDYCAAIATVKYPSGTVNYYMGYQNNSQIISGSCRSHAFMAVVNAIKGTKYSTLDLQKYLQSQYGSGVLKAKQFPKAIKHYGVTAKVYHEETSKEEAAKLMKEALDNGQPVMIFVAHSLCSDLAGTHHALLLLGYDDNGDVVFIDSVPYSRNAKKRNVEELSKCLSPSSISKNYYRMIIFSFDS